MEVNDFFAALGKRCGPGKCEECGAEKFCYTAPKSMTEYLIDQTIDRMGLAGDMHFNQHLVSSSDYKRPLIERLAPNAESIAIPSVQQATHHLWNTTHEKILQARPLSCQTETIRADASGAAEE